MIEKNHGTNANPIQQETRQIEDVVLELSSVNVHIGVHVARVIMPTVVNLQVCGSIMMRNASIENADEQPIYVVGETATPFFRNRYSFLLVKNITIHPCAHGMALAMGEHLVMRKEAIPWPKSHNMIEKKGGGFEAVGTVALVRPVEEGG
mmetsp:Transcript_25100/g.33280  ORF Transcript_25100/g.33280 Transcript_25100/m.33280 type:complete len:150 (+) Transcript_25100:937-1386(+)